MCAEYKIAFYIIEIYSIIDDIIILLIVICWANFYSIL